MKFYIYYFMIMSIALRPLIKSKFTELLDCSKAGMFTLILVVGQKELADTLSKKITSKFKSNKEHVNKPRVIWFSTEVG